MHLETPIAFAGNPLDRASTKRTDPDWIGEQQNNPDALLIPFFKGDPLMIDGDAGFLTLAARSNFPADAPLIFLGIDPKGAAYFTIEASREGVSAQQAPFSDLGEYTNLRNIAGGVKPETLSILGQARWLLDWHQRHMFCAVCGSASDIADGGAKRHCPNCQSDHFPRTDPVAIVLVQHEDHCLLGRGPHFPKGFLSCLAGFAEAGETIEECAIREIHEEAGVRVTNVEYQLSQPWPFPSSMMMGLFATATDRTLTLDVTEIEEAQWVSRQDVQNIFNGDKSLGIFLPPKFTIARQLLERWIA